ncbi:Catechol 1,2-dioxygenase-like protein [Cladobotryum mycophilum]|uniref:Catechol 1,2-dioxygenase-like protein n=1 Tax=Cladobotryum mycophilum TaxID=491253 RepID=A0ABR0T3B5_9HYPO
MAPPRFYGDEPHLKDYTAENITTNAILSNTGRARDPRHVAFMEQLIPYLHKFIREKPLKPERWEKDVHFGRNNPNTRDQREEEFMLLSHMFGVSTLVEAIHHPRPPNCTEGTIQGPFSSIKPPAYPNGTDIMGDLRGQDMLVVGSIRDTSGNPIEGVKVHAWHADSEGKYDVELGQNKRWDYTFDYDGPYHRGKFTSNEEGDFWFRTIGPWHYGVPKTIAVDNLVRVLGRHSLRPPSVHFVFEKPGYDKLITSLFVKNNRYVGTDFAISVKESLLVDVVKIDEETIKKYGSHTGADLIKYTFVLATEDEVNELKAQQREKKKKVKGKKVEKDGKDEEDKNGDRDDEDGKDRNGKGKANERPYKRVRTDAGGSRLPTLSMLLN